MHKKILILFYLGFYTVATAQPYPRGYFRSPLNIPMQLVANFGELRTNHWHMGLDVRTQQRENLPVYASADGYIARIVVEPGGFGQAIYINHPNGLTTLYAHLNAFFPVLAQHIQAQQYRAESWKIDLKFQPGQFPVNKGSFIGLSGNTGGSAGPHVHFEIRETSTEKVLNPLLFGFPIADAVPPAVMRIGMYDRNKSTYSQSPQLFSIAAIKGKTLRVGSNKISFAIGAVDRFSGSANPNGVYAAKILLDEKPVASFTLDKISYDETRYMNAHIDYLFAAKGGALLQHISPLPGATTVAYDLHSGDGLLHLKDDALHAVTIEVRDANFNTTRINFKIQFDAALQKLNGWSEQNLLPNNINIFEEEDFQLLTTERTMYDTAAIVYKKINNYAANALSMLHQVLNATIPAHDSVTVRIKPTMTVAAEWQDRIIIKNVAGSKTFVKKATWQKGLLMARFRQFGTYQAFVDDKPPTVNAPPANLSNAKRIVFTPTDNFNSIKSFKAYLNGQWLRFTNDKGKSWIYNFDEKFGRGNHQLKVRVEDEAGNVTERVWEVRR